MPPVYVLQVGEDMFYAVAGPFAGPAHDSGVYQQEPVPLFVAAGHLPPDALATDTLPRQRLTSMMVSCNGRHGGLKC